MLTLKAMDKKTKRKSLECEHCGKEYKTAAGFEARDTTVARLALHAYNEFYRKETGATKLKSPKEFEDSPYYTGFLRWANYCKETKVLEPEKFADYLVDNRIRIDLWGRDTQYDHFVVKLLQTEPVEAALERAIERSIEWGDKRDMQYSDIFRYGAENYIIQSITGGHLSPWVVYNCTSGRERMESMPAMYLEVLWPYTNLESWNKIFKQRPEEQEFAKTVLATAGW